MYKMLPAVAVPAFDDEGSSFALNKQQVILWSKVTNVHPEQKAAALIPQMACRASGKDHISNGSGAQQISRSHFAPDAAGANLREVVRLMRGRRTGRMTDAYSSEVEVRRQKAGARMATGGRIS